MSVARVWSALLPASDVCPYCERQAKGFLTYRPGEDWLKFALACLHHSPIIYIHEATVNDPLIPEMVRNSSSFKGLSGNLVTVELAPAIRLVA